MCVERPLRAKRPLCAVHSARTSCAFSRSVIVSNILLFETLLLQTLKCVCSRSHSWLTTTVFSLSLLAQDALLCLEN